jgi:hypothetical protein
LAVEPAFEGGFALKKSLILGHFCNLAHAYWPRKATRFACFLALQYADAGSQPSPDRLAARNLIEPWRPALL